MIGYWTRKLGRSPVVVPQLDEERALLRYQQLRLEMRERDGRGFDRRSKSLLL